MWLSIIYGDRLGTYGYKSSLYTLILILVGGYCTLINDPLLTSPQPLFPLPEENSDRDHSLCLRSEMMVEISVP